MNQESLLAPDLHITPSSLYVKDLQKVGAFYRDIVRLDILSTTESRWILGHDNTPVLELISKPEFANSSPRSAGLFHNAILYSSRYELAQTILHVIQQAPWSYEGSADHLVSEAFYFHDPEGNGLELYFDRPRSEWEWTDGQVKMDTLALDPERYILDNLAHKQDGTKELGHVHLRVGDIPRAHKFYIDVLGFDQTVALHGALFVSVGGYHHHMAMNTWMSRGASKRDPGLGLAEVKLILPNDGSLDALANRLAAKTVEYTLKNDGIRVADPWGNLLHFATN